MLTGGYLSEIPEPHIRMWPDTTGHGMERVLSIQVSRYEMSVVKHYHVSWEQEFNAIWDSRTMAEENEMYRETSVADEIVGWHKAWDDEEGRGEMGHNFDSTTRGEVLLLVASVVARFPDHEILVNHMDYDEWLADMQVAGPDKYYYKHEGG